MKKLLGYWNILKVRLLIFLFLLAILPTSIVGFITYMVSYDAIEKKVNRYSNQMIIQTANNLEQMLSNVQDISLQILSMRELKNYIMEKEVREQQEEYIKNVTENIIGSRNEIVGVNILFVNEQEYLVYGEPLVDLEVYKDSIQYTTTLASDKNFDWIGTYRNPNDAVIYTDIATLSRKIINEQSGEIIGVLVIGIKEFSLADCYTYLDIGPNGYYFIIDSKGKIVSDLDKRNLGELQQADYISKIINDSSTQKSITETINHEKVMITYEDIQYTDWILVSVNTYDYLMQEIRQNGRLTFYVVIGLAILSIMISIVISYSIFKPIKKLSNDMKRIEEGDFNVRTEVPGGREIEELSKQFNRMIDHIDYLVNQVYEFKIMKQEAQIHALHAQINPHFLYNTLAVIDGMAMRAGQKDIAEVAQILAAIFRYSTSGADYSKLEEEFQQLEAYIKLQSFRKLNAFEYKIVLEDCIKEVLVPKLIIQPIVENCFVHALDVASSTFFIEIRAYKVENDLLVIKVIDNGKGIDESTLKELKDKMDRMEVKDYWLDTQNGHIGLSNVYQRAINFSPKQCYIEIKSVKEKGTEVSLMIACKRGEGALESLKGE